VVEFSTGERSHGSWHLEERLDSSEEAWMSGLTREESAMLAAAFERDPEFRRDLQPLVEQLSAEARLHFARRLAGRLADAPRPRSALVPALADLMREALANSSEIEDRDRERPDG